MSKGTIATMDDCKKGDKCQFDEEASKDAKGMEGESDHTKLKSRKSVGKSLRGFLRVRYCSKFSMQFPVISPLCIMQLLVLKLLTHLLAASD
jgi:hypothetical protein